jgi:cell division protein FtsW (lipid II flippase)
MRTADRLWIAALVLSALALAALGLAVQWSISGSAPYLGDALWRKHLVWLCVGGAAGIGAAAMPTRWWRRAALPLFGLGVAALAATVAGFGTELAGARRWLCVGPLTIHVASLFQLALVLGLAWAASREPARPAIGRRIGEAIPIAAASLLPAALLYAQPDLVGAAEVLIISIGVLACSRRTWIPAAGLFAVALAAPLVLWKLLLHDYQRARILDFFSATPDVHGVGYQAAVATELVRSGGIAGRGLGSAAHEGLSHLANARTDFALVVVGHEWGWVGIAVALALVAIIVAACARVALRSKDRFASRVAVGVAALFAWQAGLHAGVSLGLLPVLSTPGFPLLSYGGSGTIAALVCAGLVIRGAGGLTTLPPP